MIKPFSIIACTHGDEPVGKLALESLARDSTLAPLFEWTIGNPRALARGIRFVSRDLNRSAPGRLFGPYEVRRARAVLQWARKRPIVLDLHQTMVNDRIVAIVTNLTTENLALASCFSTDAVLLWPSSDPAKKTGPLVSYVPIGIEIECGAKTSLSVTTERLERLLREFLKAHGLLTRSQLVFRPEMLEKRDVYLVGRTIHPDDLVPEKPLVDFEPYDSPSGTFIPLLFGKHAGLLGYRMTSVDTNDMTHLCYGQEVRHVHSDY